MRIFRRLQRRIGPVHVAGIATLKIGEDIRIVCLQTLGHQFRMAAARAYFRARRDIQLNIRVRANDGTNIAAIENRARRLGCEISLGIEQSFSDAWHGGYLGRSLTDFMVRQNVAVECIKIDVACNLGREALIVERQPNLQQGLSNRAIYQAGIEMAQAVMSRQPAGQSTFTGCGRTIDCYDDRFTQYPPPDRA